MMHAVDLLVVGGPTHAFGMSRPGTRQSAAQQAERGLVSARIGLREWLGTLPESSGRVAVATFDTRIAKPRLPGSAAAAAEKRLRRLGFRLVVPSKSFYVEGTTGPLVDGEPERARRWGDEQGCRALGRAVMGRTTGVRRDLRPTRRRAAERPTGPSAPCTGAVRPCLPGSRLRHAGDHDQVSSPNGPP
jgi:hypothetical protein